METWSVGKAVLHGIGLEMTKDFRFLDLLVMLLEEDKKMHKPFFDLIYVYGIVDEGTCHSVLPVQTFDDEGFS